MLALAKVKVTKALSLKQPWAWLMTAAEIPAEIKKWIENRDWLTYFRGECYVHASKGWDEDNFPINADGTFEIDATRADGRQLPFPPGMSRRVEDYQRGGIVGKFTVFDCVSESNDVWFFGKWGFLVKDAQPVPFVACRGSLNFFELPEDVLAQLAQAQVHVQEPQLQAADQYYKRLYTIGYGNVASAEWLAKLVKYMGATLLDIRYSARSARPGFNKAELERIFRLADAGQDYHHLPEFGNVNFNNDEPIKLNRPGDVASLVHKLLKAKPLILMCQCRDYHQCHRQTAACWIADYLDGQSFETNEHSVINNLVELDRDKLKVLKAEMDKVELAKLEKPEQQQQQPALFAAPTFAELYAQYRLSHVHQLRIAELPLIRPKQQQQQERG